MTSAPIAYRKPKSGRLVLLFLLSIGVHVGGAFLVIWAGEHLGRPEKPEAAIELGMDVVLGEEVQELIVAENTPDAAEPPPPEEPPPPPPEPPAEEEEPPAPEPPPPAEEPEFVEPPPVPKATPAPKRPSTPRPEKPKAAAVAQVAPPGAKRGPVPRPGVVGGNVTQGATTGTPGGQKVGAQGWRTPRPPFPPAALASRIQGSGEVRISTDGSGNVSSVTITRPIHALLDSNTRKFALGNWKGPPNSTRTVPVIYNIR